MEIHHPQLYHLLLRQGKRNRVRGSLSGSNTTGGEDGEGSREEGEKGKTEEEKRGEEEEL